MCLSGLPLSSGPIVLVEPKQNSGAIGYVVTEVRTKTSQNGLLKDYGLVPIQEDAVFHVPTNGARQNNFFNVPAFLDEIVDGVAMVDAGDILVDDGTIVEHLSHVVRSGADQLDAPLERLVVGLRAHERGQERMVNIDEVFRAPSCNELVREHLHITCKNHEAAPVFADECDLFLLRLPLIFSRYRHDKIRDTIELGDALVIGMVGHDQWNLATQFPALVAVKQVLQTMVIFRDENGDARPVGRVGEPPAHLEVAGYGSKFFLKTSQVKIEVCRVKLNSSKKKIRFLIPMLIVEKYVAVMAEDEIGDRCNNSLAVGAGDEKNGGVLHR
jgi:hypothetical protein